MLRLRAASQSSSPIFASASSAIRSSWSRMVWTRPRPRTASIPGPEPRSSVRIYRRHALPFFINDYGSNLFKFGYALGVNGCNCPLNENEKQIQFVNNWTRIAGSHTIKFGADIRQAYNLRVPSDQHRGKPVEFQRCWHSGTERRRLRTNATFLLGNVPAFSSVTLVARRMLAKNKTAGSSTGRTPGR